MNFTWETNKRVAGMMALMVTVLTGALLMDVETARGWAVIGMVTIAAGAVLLHFTRDLPQTTSQAINEARR